MQVKKHNKEGSVTEEMTPGQRFWGWASGRREGNELGLEERTGMKMQKQRWMGGQWSFQTHGLSWAKWTGDEPGISLRAGWCSFPCSLLHLRALALYKINNRHTVDDSLKLDTNETKFRVWLGDNPMVWSVKTTGWDQGEDKSSWHGEQLRQGIQGWQDEGWGTGGPHASGGRLRTRGRVRGEMREGQTRAEDGGFKLIYVKYWKR